MKEVSTQHFWFGPLDNKPWAKPNKTFCNAVFSFQYLAKKKKSATMLGSASSNLCMRLYNHPIFQCVGRICLRLR